MRQRSRPYLFSNSLPPAVVGCASKALDLLMESNTIIQSMAAKTRRYGAHRGGSEWEMVATHLSAFSCPPPSFPSHPLCLILFLQSPVPSLVTPIFPPPVVLPAPACAPLALWACTSCLFSFLSQVGIDPEPLPQAPWPSATRDTQLCPQVPQ